MNDSSKINTVVGHSLFNMTKVKVLEITTATCGICKAIAPIISKAVDLLGDKVEFEKREVTWDDDIVKEHDIRQVPTFLFFKDDKLVDKHVGPIMLPEFTKKVNNLADEQ